MTAAPRPRQTALAAALLALSAGLMLPGIASSLDWASRVLVVLEEGEPQWPYPFMARSMSEQRLSELLFQRLFRVSTGGELVSDVFEPGWTQIPPELRVDVKEDLKFCDGRSADFSDVAFTMNSVYRRSDIGHQLAPTYTSLFDDAQQVSYRHGNLGFKVAMPETGAAYYLINTPLLSQAALGESDPFKVPDVTAHRRKPVGTGPFCAPAAGIRDFDDIRLDRNPYKPIPDRLAKDSELTPVQKIRLRYDQDPAMQKQLIQGGRADIWVAPPPAVLPEFRNQSSRFGVRGYELKQQWFVAVNVGEEPLSDPRVREALDKTIPREELAAKLGEDAARLSSGPFPPGSAWSPPDALPTALDPAGADKLLEWAGFAKKGGVWAKDGKLLTIKLGVQADILDDANDVVYGLSEAWIQAGFAVEVQGITLKRWREDIEGGDMEHDFDLILGRWNTYREDSMIELFTWSENEPRPLNLFRYHDDVLNDLSVAFWSETHMPEREALMQQFHKRAARERPYLFLWNLNISSVYRRDRVAGFRPTPFYFFTEVQNLAWRSGPPTEPVKGP